MSDIGFYHLTRTTAEQALPRLLGRTLAAGQRAVVLCGGEARVTALDEALWSATDPDWLPHGCARTGEADLQPIWLTAVEEAPNAARYLFLIDGATADPAGVRARVRPVRRRGPGGGAGRPPALDRGQGRRPHRYLLAAGGARLGEKGLMLSGA